VRRLASTTASANPPPLLIPPIAPHLSYLLGEIDRGLISVRRTAHFGTCKAAMAIQQ